MRDLFARFASRSAQAIGSASTFSLYVLGLVIWLVLGPLTHWSDTWQLWANTITSLGTTAICLLIQNTVNHDTRSLHLKLDEMLRAQQGARNTFINLEGMSERDMDRLQDELARIRARSTQTERGRDRGEDTDRAPT